MHRSNPRCAESAESEGCEGYRQAFGRTCDDPGYELVMVEPLCGYDAADSWGRHVAAVTSA